MALSTGVKTAIVQQEIGAIEQLIYQATIRHKVAERVNDEDMKKQVVSNLEKLEARLQAFREILGEIEAEKNQQEGKQNEQG